MSKLTQTIPGLSTRLKIKLGIGSSMIALGLIITYAGWNYPHGLGFALLLSTSILLFDIFFIFLSLDSFKKAMGSIHGKGLANLAKPHILLALYWLIGVIAFTGLTHLLDKARWIRNFDYYCLHLSNPVLPGVVLLWHLGQIIYFINSSEAQDTPRKTINTAIGFWFVSLATFTVACYLVLAAVALSNFSVF